MENKESKFEQQTTLNNGETVIDVFGATNLGTEEPLSEEVQETLQEMVGDINEVQATDANNQEILKEEVKSLIHFQGKERIRKS